MASDAAVALAKRLDKEDPNWRQENSKQLKSLAPIMKQIGDEMKAEWASVTDDPFPTDAEKWVEYCSQFGMSFDRAMDGKFTLAEVWPIIIGRLKAADQNQQLSPEQIRKMTGLSIDRINKLIREHKLKPTRGDVNRYKLEKLRPNKKRDQAKAIEKANRTRRMNAARKENGL